MALQRVMNGRMMRRRKRKNSRWMSFSTIYSASPTSTSSSDSSSNSDTEYTGSLIQENNGATLGSLLGVSSILEVHKRLLIRRAKTEVVLKSNKKEKKSKSKLWLLLSCLLCSRHDSENNHNSPSLGQFLALERRVSNEIRKNQMHHITAEPSSQNCVGTEIKESRGLLGNGNNLIEFESFAEMFSCFC